MLIIVIVAGLLILPLAAVVVTILDIIKDRARKKREHVAELKGR